MMELSYSALQWDTLPQAQRIQLLLAAKLPTSLASAHWSQLTTAEQSDLYHLDWFFILRNNQGRKSGPEWTTRNQPQDSNLNL
jgi:hypothetical protein